MANRAKNGPGRTACRPRIDSPRAFRRRCIALAVLVLMPAMPAAGAVGAGETGLRTPAAPVASLRQASARRPPPRIASLDYCADAHVLALAEEGEVVALSAEADAPYAWAGRRAPGLPRLVDGVEGLVALRPDLVVTTAGHARAADLAERAGLRVLRLGYLNGIEDSFSALRRLAAALGRGARAETVIRETRARLRALERRASARRAGERPLALYLTPSGITTGGGTYVDRLIRLAGLRNLLAERGVKGWSRLRLEDFVRLRPDVVISSFFAARRGWQESWRLTAHPLARRLLRNVRHIVVPAGSWGCAGFYAVEAAERIVAALDRRRAAANGMREDAS